MSEVKAQGMPGRIFVSHGRSDERGEEYIRADIARELAEALIRLEQSRHVHVACDEGSACRSCGMDARNEVHYRLDESNATDMERARAALAKWREAQEEGS